LYYVSPNQINFYVPMSAPTSGTADLVVMQASTGRIYAAGLAGMQAASPGIFNDFGGKQRIAAVRNADQTANTPTNGAVPCTYITIYATGQGFIPDAPPDGSPAPSSPLLSTPYTPRVNIGGFYVDEAPKSCDPPNGFVQFSGLAPGFVGVWQINVWLPGATPPATQVPMFIQAFSIPSNDGSFFTNITVKAKP